MKSTCVCIIVRNNRQAARTAVDSSVDLATCSKWPFSKCSFMSLHETKIREKRNKNLKVKAVALNANQDVARLRTKLLDLHLQIKVF